MITTFLVLIVSIWLFLCLRVFCERRLRWDFENVHFIPVAKAHGLEFPAIREAIENTDVPVDYARVNTRLKSDFRTVTLLLKNAAHVTRGYGRDEWLMILYFRLIFFSLVARHLLRRREDPAILKLAAILQYFANDVGERMNEMRVTNPVFLDLLQRV